LVLVAVSVPSDIAEGHQRPTRSCLYAITIASAAWSTQKRNSTSSDGSPWRRRTTSSVWSRALRASAADCRRSAWRR